MRTFAVTSVLSIDRITLADGVERVTVGSCGFYVAMALAKLGADVLYAGASGEDYPREADELLHAAGAGVARCSLPGPNARLRLHYDATGHIASGHYDEGGGAAFRAEHLPDAFWKSDVLWLCTAPHALHEGVVRRADVGQAVVLSTQGEFASRAHELQMLVPRLSALFANAHEVAGYGFGGLAQGLDALFSTNPDLEVLVTRGERGAWRVTRDTLEWVPSVQPPKIFNTTGAGDTFAAGYMLSRARGASTADALLFASCAAALSLRGYAYFELPTSVEVNALTAAYSSLWTVDALPRSSDAARQMIALEAEHLGHRA